MNIFGNIEYYLAKNGDIKVGDFETEMGVSQGYISRAKKSGSMPSLDFCVKLADRMNVSLDTLMKVNLSKLNDTERLIVSFIDTLIANTSSGKLEWKIFETHVYAEIAHFKSVHIVNENGQKGLYLDVYREKTEEGSEGTLGVICTTKDMPLLSEIINKLFSLALANARAPKLAEEVREAIEDYLGGTSDETAV